MMNKYLLSILLTAFIPVIGFAQTHQHDMSQMNKKEMAAPKKTPP
ncbi:MAG: hypothetical protein JWQ78_1481, partial [Sediminibacterium sp.]|nr:hypothetical protein [Sediminibacterium sp.]